MKKLESPSGTRVPKYQQTAKRIHNLIESGTFKETLPSQDQLSNELGVSRPTIREAIRVLEENNIVFSRQGASTKISKKPLIESGIEELTSASEIVARSNSIIATSSIKIHQSFSTEGSFSVFSGKSILVIERVRTTDGVPFVLSIDVIPNLNYDENNVLEELSNGSFFNWLHTRGIFISYSKTYFSPIIVDSSITNKLSVPTGTPLLFMEETGFKNDNEPAYYSNDFYRSDITHFYLLRQRSRKMDNQL